MAAEGTPIAPKTIAIWKAMVDQVVQLGDLADRAADVLPPDEAQRTRELLSDVLVTLATQAVPQLLAEREEMLEMLREVEWSKPVGVDGCIDACPACLGQKPWRNERGDTGGGHAPDCRLAAFLR
jgi:hypothetical protein